MGTIDAGELTWTPPGPGRWGTIPDHFPKPVCELFAELFPAITVGSTMSAQTYGLPAPSTPTRFAAVNGWFYFGFPTAAGPADDDVDLVAMEATARETLETKRWRAEARHWAEVERPAVMAANLALQDVEVTRLGDDALADHFAEAVEHFRISCPLHFADGGFSFAKGALHEACARWGIPPEEVVGLLAGASPASTAGRDHAERIADALREAGVTQIESLRDIVSHPTAAVALHDYLRFHGCRLVENRDLVDPTLIERPDLIVAGVQAALSRPPTVPPDHAARAAALRSMVPEEERALFDELVEDARACYGIGDDDEGVCFLWPLGLIRRAVLEIGRRLVERGVIDEARDLLDARTWEIEELLDGDPEFAPTAAELAARRDLRLAAAALTPPGMIGSDPSAPKPAAEAEAAGNASPPAWPPSVQRLMDLRSKGSRGHAPPSDEVLTGMGIGAGAYAGRAIVVTDGVDALGRLEPGDVIVAVATNPGFNAAFPIAGAVVTEEGGVFCHAAILARELAMPAVVGLGGIREIHDGDLIEVDADAGVVRILERA